MSYNDFMTIDELKWMIELKQEFEFTHDGVKYNFFYDKDADGNTIIIFGEQYFGKKYKSFGQLINEAFVGNSYLKDFILSVKR